MIFENIENKLNEIGATNIKIVAEGYKVPMLCFDLYDKKYEIKVIRDEQEMIYNIENEIWKK